MYIIFSLSLLCVKCNILVFMVFRSFVLEFCALLINYAHLGHIICVTLYQEATVISYKSDFRSLVKQLHD
jgi:hypothetical protein